MKFTTACQDHQAGESAVKYLSQGHNRMARAGFELRRNRHHGALNHLTTLPKTLMCVEIVNLYEGKQFYY